MRSTPLVLLLLPLACASSAAQAPDIGRGAVEGGRAVAVAVGRGAVATGRAVGQGAVATGRGMGTAYRGLRDGFQAPEGGGYGPAPKRYVHLIKRHFVRALDYPEDARFAFRRPVRGYMNYGLLRGGGVAWQGWLVDVKVETDRLMGEEARVEQLVVRVRGGEVIDVHAGDDLLHRVE